MPRALCAATGSTSASLDGTTPLPSVGDVMHHYAVDLLAPIAGEATASFHVAQMVEADFARRPPGTLLLLSVCPREEGGFREPDVGYLFPLPPSCLADAEGVARRLRSAHLAPGDAACR